MEIFGINLDKIGWVMSKETSELVKSKYLKLKKNLSRKKEGKKIKVGIRVASDKRGLKMCDN